MLPASQTPRSQSQRSATISLWQIGLIAFVVVFTLVVSIGLLTNAVRSDRVNLLFVVPCLLPMIWCTVGFGQRSHDLENDSGLLLSAVGWLLIAFSFIFKHLAVVRAGADAYAAQASSPATLLCGIVGIVLIVAGAVYSWQFWLRNYNS